MLNKHGNLHDYEQYVDDLVNEDNNINNEMLNKSLDELINNNPNYFEKLISENHKKLTKAQKEAMTDEDKMKKAIAIQKE